MAAAWHAAMCQAVGHLACVRTGRSQRSSPLYPASSHPDPQTADVVRRIFADYLAGKGLKATAEGPTADGIPSPSAYDPARNRHRCGIAWSWGAVAAILGNPRYTGRQVWNRQRKHGVLVDVDDVALGFTTKQRWNQPGEWIWSEQPVHEPLIATAAFDQVQAMRRARSAAGPALATAHAASTPSRTRSTTPAPSTSAKPAPAQPRPLAGHEVHAESPA